MLRVKLTLQVARLQSHHNFEQIALPKDVEAGLVFARGLCPSSFSRVPSTAVAANPPICLTRLDKPASGRMPYMDDIALSIHIPKRFTVLLAGHEMTNFQFCGRDLSCSKEDEC